MNMLKAFLISNSNILVLVSFFYNSINLFRIRCNNKSELKYLKAFLRRTWIRVKNENNTIMIMNGSLLENCFILIHGKHNTIIIGKNCRLKDVELHIEDNNNSILIGNNTTIAGKTHIACIEGTKIAIGEDCMLSKDIVFRTGDSHSIIDEKGERINPSKDISIGNHVWVGNKVIVTKGASVGDNSILGTGSIVTKSFEKTNVIITGYPAKIVKENINWLRKRI
jgi:acetyltransferase-like isoleucine patch superfamily enzyme